MLRSPSKTRTSTPNTGVSLLLIPLSPIKMSFPRATKGEQILRFRCQIILHFLKPTSKLFSSVISVKPQQNYAHQLFVKMPSRDFWFVTSLVAHMVNVTSPDLYKLLTCSWNEPSLFLFAFIIVLTRLMLVAKKKFSALDALGFGR
ncbi:unnamed protein product [Lactuca saligna]|uniref:Uncharacterized protein n=1 Tax=Lactuca saligna TaxID=75948 RepID=A0AA36E1Z5_LACSI|nr:unnamed protein product [Lactuca saligna]